MNIAFKLALKSIIRSPGKFILQGAILSVFMFIVFVSVSTQAGASKAIDDARGQFCGEVRLAPDFDKAGEAQEGKITGMPYVTETLGDRLLASRYIAAHNYYFGVPVASDILPPEIQSERFKVLPKSDEAGLNAYSFTLAGNSSPALYPNFANGGFKLISGSFPPEEDGGEERGNAVISRPLAEKNGFGVGSTFMVRSPDLKIKQELKVAGIFDWSGRDASEASFVMASGHIFVSLEIARKFNGSAAPGSPADVLTYASYFLDNPDHLDEFIKEAGSMSPEMGKFRLYANDDEYMRTTAQLRRLEVLTGIVLVAGLAVGAAFLILCVFSVIKRRDREIGLLRTMGVGKKNILFQHIFELLMVGFIALAAAAISEVSWGSPASDTFFKEQIRLTHYIDQSSVISIYVTESSDSAAIMRYGSQAAGNAVKSSDAIDKVEAVTGPGQVLLFLLSGFLVILCGASAAALKVLRHNPMAALRRIED